MFSSRLDIIQEMFVQNLKLPLSSPLVCFPQDGVVSLKEACGMLRCVGFGHHVNIL